MKDITQAVEVIDEDQDDLAAGANPEAERRTLKPMVRAVIAGLVLLIGIVLGVLLIVSKPKAEKKPPSRVIPRVTAAPFAAGSEQVVVKAMGTVMPAREIILKARVSGEVLEVHPEFIPGGRVQQGETLLQIERNDYEAVVAQAQSRLAQADYDYQLELGRQDVALREWEVMGEPPDATKTDRELALRKPHLKFFKAALEAANANLEQSELNLRRTSITAPFNAVVQQRMVERGSQVSPQDGLANLVATDEYWVQVSLPVDRLAWIRFPTNGGEDGSAVTVHYGSGTREGRVIRLLSDLEQTGRMARVLVAVVDPLGPHTAKPADGDVRPPAKTIPLLLGSYVRVDMAGRHLDDVIRLPRTALRDNDRIWVMNGENRLDIRTVKPVWRGEEYVLVRNGFKPDERLVLSGIPLPIQGMALQLDEPDPAKAGESDAL